MRKRNFSIGFTLNTARAMAGGYDVREIAAILGVDRKTLLEWLKAHRDEVCE